MLTILNTNWFTSPEARFLKAALLRCILSEWGESHNMRGRVMIARRHVMPTGVNHG